MDFNDATAWPLDEIDEIVIRPSKYDLVEERAEQFQVVVKSRDRSELWGVGVHVCALEALATAIHQFHHRHDATSPPVEDPEIEDLLE